MFSQDFILYSKCSLRTTHRHTHTDINTDTDTHTHIYIYIYIYIYIHTKPISWVGYDTRSNFKGTLTGSNSEFFSFSKAGCHTKVKDPSLHYYLSIAGRRIIRFIPSPRVLALCEMQTASSRIWTLVTVSISYDNNNYTTGPFTYGPQMFHKKCWEPAWLSKQWKG